VGKKNSHTIHVNVQVAAEAKAKKKKQKIISTGGLQRGLNPRQKLYCVCKTPYDESRWEHVI